MNVTVTVKNQGNANAGAFYVDIYKNLSTAPTVASDIYCSMSGGLAAGSTTTCTRPVQYDASGTYKMWGVVDIDKIVAESVETNNTKYKLLTVQ